MKTETMHRIEKICEDNNLHIVSSGVVSSGRLMVVLEDKKDVWEGVEFAFHKLKGIDRIREINGDFVYFYPESRIISTLKKHLEPSTESAYIEQLKRIAKEKFGEIKPLDRFHRFWHSKKPTWSNPATIDHTKRGFEYSKVYDQLFFNGTCIYEKGSWAEKLPDRVKVELDSYTLAGKSTFVFDLNNYKIYGIGKKQGEDIGQFLAQQLESYLNQEK